MRITTPRLALSLVAIGAAATAAQAASPEGGTISKSEREVTWSGSLTSSGTYYNAWMEDPSVPCENPPQGATACDPFNLKIAETGDASVTLNLAGTAVQGNNGNGGIRVTKPDGSYVYVTGESGDNVPLVLDLPGAAAGDYVVHSVASYVCCGPTDYRAAANFKSGAAPAPPAGGGQQQTPPPSGGDQPAPQPQPQPTPEQPAPPQQQQSSQGQLTSFNLTAKAPKLSSRKVRKSKGFSVRVATSRPIQKLTATFRKGKKTLGKVTVTNFKGSGAVKFKYNRKLKPGIYSVTLVGNDRGVTVGRTLKLRVRR